MNLLDQLAIFCKPAVSINLVQSPTGDHKAQRQPRHHSVITENKAHDNRATKSIQKIQTWAPANKSQSKQRIILRLTRTLSNKVRKHYFTFWVNYEQAAKNSIKNCKENNQKMGAQKIIGFTLAYQAKQCQHIGLGIAFTKLTKFSKIKAVEICIQKAINPALERSKKSFLQTIQQQQKSTLKIELLINSLDMMVLNKFKSQVFQNIQKYVRISKSSVNAYSGNSVKKSIIISYAKKIKQPMNKMKILTYIPKKELQVIPDNIQNFQPNIKTFSRQPIDKFIQNCPQSSDNSLLFIQKPLVEIEEKQPIQYFLDKHQQQIIELENLMKTKRTYPKPPICIGSPMYESHILKGQVNLLQNQDTMKKSYLTPRNRSISSASIFNIDENRISKLQKKLFGDEINTDKNQSRFMVNGQDWMSDRKALDQIMNNMRSPSKYRRNSAYDIQLSNIRQKIQAYREKQNFGGTQKHLKLKLAQSQCQLKSEKSLLLKKFINEQEKNSKMKLKTQNKILVAIKSRKKEAASSNKSQQWRKMSERENQGKKLTGASRR